MTHPPNSYRYQPATDFENQESGNMYQHSHQTHMPQAYEEGQRGLQQGILSHPRRSSSLADQVTASLQHNAIHHYDWKNFAMAPLPASFLPSPEETSSMHDQGHMSGSAMTTAPYPFVAAGSPFSHQQHLLPPLPSSSTSTSSSSSPSPLLSAPSALMSVVSQSPAATYGSSPAGQSSFATPSLNTPNLLPEPSSNFGVNSSLGYSFMPALPPPLFGDGYFQTHRAASHSAARCHDGAMANTPGYPLPAHRHAGAMMGSPRLALLPAPNFYPGMDLELYAPPLPYHPAMTGHPASLYFQNPSRSTSPSMSPSLLLPQYPHGSSSLACHPFPRSPLLSSGSSTGSSGPRLACRPCIRGHRAPSCKHIDRPLFAIRPRGRPSSQCVHCKEARRSGGIHVKCLCGSGSSDGNIAPKSSNSISSYATSATEQPHKSGGMATAGLSSTMPDTAVYSTASLANQGTGSRLAGSKSALAAVMQSFWSGIHGPESDSLRSQDSDAPGKPARFETGAHLPSLPAEATDTVSQGSPELLRSADHNIAAESRPEAASMTSRCICCFGMPCLCSSRPERLSEQAEPASIAKNIHQRRERSQAQQIALHAKQPIDHNCYGYDRLNRPAASEHRQEEDNNRTRSCTTDGDKSSMCL